MKTGTWCVCLRRNLAMQYKVTFLQLTALVRAYKHFPSIVPKRWHLVSQFVAKCSENFSEHSPIMLESVLPNLPFDGSPNHCRKVCRDLEVHQPRLLFAADQQAQILFPDPSTNAFKLIVLLPPVDVCCGRKLLIRYSVDQLYNVVEFRVKSTS